MAQQQATIPNTHGGVRGIINANATDAETRLSKADKCRMGWADFNDLATQSTPIAITSAGGWTLLTNDKAGPNTNTNFLPEGVTSSVFASNQFNFIQLDIGDCIDVRLDLLVTTTSPNQNVLTRLRMGIGSPSEFSIIFTQLNYKSAGLNYVSRYNGIYIGSNDIKNYPAKFEIMSDANASVKVNGWFCKFLLRGEAS